MKLTPCQGNSEFFVFSNQVDLENNKPVARSGAMVDGEKSARIKGVKGTYYIRVQPSQPILTQTAYTFDIEVENSLFAMMDHKMTWYEQEKSGEVEIDYLPNSMVKVIHGRVLQADSRTTSLVKNVNYQYYVMSDADIFMESMCGLTSAI